MTNPLISIAIITYNQDQFIAESIESVLKQELNLDYELLISDDASTDGTINILKSYKTKYPDKIRLILNKTNLGPSENFHHLILQCKGEFIFLLEGDDFWTSSEKIQKQYQFLIENPSYLACTHRHKIVDENGNILVDEYTGPGKSNLGEYTLNDFENYRYCGFFGTMAFRNIFLKKPEKLIPLKYLHNFIVDISLNLIIVLNGPIFILNENMAAHRILIKKGGTNFKSTIRRKNQVKNRLLYLDRLKQFAKKDYNINIDFVKRNEKLFIESILFMMRYPSKSNFSVLIFVFLLNNNKIKLLRFILSKTSKMPGILLSQIKKEISN